MALYLSREDVGSLLNHEICVPACEEGLKAEGMGEVEAPPRINMNTWTTILRLMPAMIKSMGLLGLRIYNIPAGPGVTVKLVYLLYDSRDGTLKAMMDADPTLTVIQGQNSQAISRCALQQRLCPDSSPRADFRPRRRALESINSGSCPTPLPDAGPSTRAPSRPPREPPRRDLRRARAAVPARDRRRCAPALPPRRVAPVAASCA